MLVNSNTLLQNALKEGYAIPAYNINNLEWTRFILEACSDDKSPVIPFESPTVPNAEKASKTKLSEEKTPFKIKSFWLQSKSPIMMHKKQIAFIKIEVALSIDSSEMSLLKTDGKFLSFALL